ncbi:MAG: tetratricopeptide repeat protein [Armatimonadetes bacterium]|nr:tetratricopeptide repeat protein [Armatimonadota bacterium]
MMLHISGSVADRRRGAPGRWWMALLLAAAITPAFAAAGESQFDFANGLYQRKLYSLAIPEFEKFLQSSPASPKAPLALFHLANCHFGAEDWAKAASAYDRALQKHPTEKFADDARFFLGQCHFNLEAYDKAAAAFGQIIARSKEKTALARAQYWLGETEFARGRLPQAEAAYRALVEKHPESDLVSYGYYSLGVCAEARGDAEAAARAFQTVVQRFGDFGAIDEVRVRLGDALRTLKRYPEARQAYAAVTGEKMPPALRAAALLGIAYCALEEKDYAAAAAGATESGKLADPASRERLEAELVVAGARYGLKEYDAALTHYRVVAAGGEADLAEQALYWSGSALRAQKKPDEAIALFEQLIERFPSGTLAGRARLRVGDCHADAGRAAQAAAAYRVALEKHSGTDAAKEARAAISDLLGSVGDGADTSQLARVVGQLPPGAVAADAQVQLAQKEFAAGHFQEAVAWAEKVLAGKPTPEATEQALYLLGAAKLQMKDPGGAVEAYNRAVVSFPQGRLTNQALLELAWAQLDLKRFADAEKTAQQLAARNPGGDLRVTALLTLADAATAAGDYPRAEAACVKALEGNPRTETAVSARYAYAWAAHRQKEWATAAARWQRALEASRALKDSPLTPRAAYFLGYALTQLRRFAEAIPGLELAAGSTIDLAEQARYDLGWNYLELKEPEKAAAEFERLAADHPQGRLAAEALFLAGQQHFEKKEYAAAAERYRRAEAARPQGDLAYKVAMQLGAAFYYVPDYPAAAEAFARAAGLAGAEGAPEATYWAGDACAKAGRWADARQHAERYLALAPKGERVGAAGRIAARAALALRDPEGAIALAGRALPGAQGDDAAEIQFCVGDALAAQRKHAEAATAYLRVAILHPESAWAGDAQLRAGEAFEAAGDGQRAAEVYRALADRYPQSPAAAKARERLADK